MNNDQLFGAFLGLTVDQVASIADTMATESNLMDDKLAGTVSQIRATLRQAVNGISGKSMYTCFRVMHYSYRKAKQSMVYVA